MTIRPTPAIVCAVLALALPATALGTNGNKPRAPATFAFDHCLLEVDRSVTPLVELPQGLIFEDLTPGPDELADSRTHQLVALCRDHEPEDALPNWIYADDAQRALDAGIIAELPPADEVLLTAADWQDGHGGAANTCVVEVETAATRRPIACSSVADPVVWDTTGVPAGAYVIRAHTFEPFPNLWSERNGVVWIHDGDREQARPAAALVSPHVNGAFLYQNEPFSVLGCVAGPSGTTAQVEWAIATDPDNWHEFATIDADPSSCEFEVPFAAPDDAIGQAIFFRVRAAAPNGEAFTSHARGRLLAMPEDGETAKPLPVDPVDLCGSLAGHGAPASVPCPAGTEPQSPCSCRSRPTTFAPLFLLLLAALRRRKSR